MSESMQEFYTVLDELVGDQSVDQVRVEFEKLIQALKKSRENEKRLMAKCRELNAEIVSSSSKVSAALQLSQDDQTTITSLKRVRSKSHVPTCTGTLSFLCFNCRSSKKRGRWSTPLTTRRRGTKTPSGTLKMK